MPASSATASSVPRIVEYDQRNTGTVEPGSVVVVVPAAVVVVPARVVVVVPPPPVLVVNRRSSTVRVDAVADVFWNASATNVAPAGMGVVSRHDIVCQDPVAAGNTNEPFEPDPTRPFNCQVPVPE